LKLAIVGPVARMLIVYFVLNYRLQAAIAERGRPTDLREWSEVRLNIHCYRNYPSHLPANRIFPFDPSVGTVTDQHAADPSTRRDPSLDKRCQHRRWYGVREGRVIARASLFQGIIEVFGDGCISSASCFKAYRHIEAS
jgi:hypothetical protein